MIRFDSSADQIESIPPAELLCAAFAAFAACLLKNVERFSRMLPFRYERAAVEVTAGARMRRFVRIAFELRVRTDKPEPASAFFTEAQKLRRRVQHPRRILRDGGTADRHP